MHPEEHWSEVGDIGRMTRPHQYPMDTAVRTISVSGPRVAQYEPALLPQTPNKYGTVVIAATPRRPRNTHGSVVKTRLSATGDAINGLANDIGVAVVASPLLNEVDVDGRE